MLGSFGWQSLLPVLAGAGWTVPRPRPRFGHGAHVQLAGGPRPLHVFGSYHVSQQNTFTGRLTPTMLEGVLTAAAEAAGLRLAGTGETATEQTRAGSGASGCDDPRP